MNNYYNNIILSSTLFGSIYLFSFSYKILSDRAYKKFNPIDAVNVTIMLCSGIIILNTGIKTIKLLNNK